MDSHVKTVNYGKKSSRYTVICFAPLNSLTDEYVRTLYEPLIASFHDKYSVYTVQLSLFETSDVDKELQSVISAIEEAMEKEILLAGWCSGGVLALKAAELLNQTGAAVKGIVLLDTYEPEYADRIHNSKMLSLKELRFPAYYVHSFLLQMDNNNRYFRSNQCLNDINELCDDELVDFVYENMKELGYTREISERLLYRSMELNLHVNAQSTALLKSVELTPCSHKIILVKAKQQNDIMDDYLGWKELLGENLLLQQSRWTHDIMLIEENVMEITGIIEKLLED